MRRRDGRCGWCVAVWLCAGPGLTAWALSVSPPVVELRVSAGARSEGSFLVRNDTQQPLVLTVETEALSPQGYLQRPCADWLQVAPDRLVLEPGQQDEVRYTVSVPAGAQGELAAEVVFVQAFSSPETGGVQVRFGMALYVSIAGTEQLDLRVEPMRLQAGQPPTVWIPMTNQGNVHCRPQGTVTVIGVQGQLVAQGILSRGLPVPPAQTATFSVPLGETLMPPGTYRLLVDLTCHATANLPAHVSVEQAGHLDENGQWIASQTASSPKSR